MLWTMIRKEWVRNLLELRFLVCAVLCVFLALVSVLVLRIELFDSGIMVRLRYQTMGKNRQRPLRPGGAFGLPQQRLPRFSQQLRWGAPYEDSLTLSRIAV